MKQTGRFSTEFLSRLAGNGKVNWPESLVTRDVFEAFRVQSGPLYNELLITLRSPPPELCREFREDGSMQSITVVFFAGSPHAGPLADKGSKAFRHLLFATDPPYMSDVVDKPYGRKRQQREPLAHGELERKLFELRCEANALLEEKQNMEDIALVQRQLLETIPHFEKKYRTDAVPSEPLTAMDGSSHRYFVRRVLKVAFTQPSINAMRATLWGKAQEELGALFEPDYDTTTLSGAKRPRLPEK